MKIIKYFLEFIFVSFLLIIFKLIGYKNASNFGKFSGQLIGPLFRSKSKILKNLEDSNIKNDKEKIINQMWGNYGRILAEYVYLKQFKNGKFSKYISIEGLENLEEIKQKNKKVVFVSGHFNNFELMAMQLENFGIDLAAVYRPLNNIFLNFIMEKIRTKNICKNQIKKGRSNIRNLLKLFNDGHSIALMIDQRVSESIQSPFFGKDAYTTTIPAQFVKKFKCKVVPIYIERKNNVNFEVTVYTPLNFEEKETINEITRKLNKNLEQMILINPSKWIWSHNRWK